MINYDAKIASRLNIRPEQVGATIRLLDDGNTVPFIARYRKEATLNLDEFLIRQIAETVEKMRAVDERRETIIKSIDEQGKLTPQLQQKLAQSETMTELEDLYQPYKPKRKTRGSIARERGLEGLAERVLSQAVSLQSLYEQAMAFLSEVVPTVEDALAGARDIVAEIISDDARVRGSVREKAQQWGVLVSKLSKNAKDEKAIYETYYQFSVAIKNAKAYQVLAINRGEAEKVLSVGVEVAERDWLGVIEHYYRVNARSVFASQLQEAIMDSAKRLLLPAIERDIRRYLTELAEAHAIQVFADNLRGLLSQPPLVNQVVMGIDPAYRTGCKIAVVDEYGKLLETLAIYPHEPQREYQKALLTLQKLIRGYGVTLIAIGNGTASRETEALVAELTRQQPNVKYAIVNEAGASVYSASEMARQEFPTLDVSIRGAVSIARRIQDPLAELVKIDPKSIGVGLYQHDVDQKQLSGTLDAVVESVVNRVGVDVNTASAALLQYVAGIGAKLAQNIVSYRETNGIFVARDALKRVSGMGAKAYEQSAGFLRVRGGKNPLDATAIHPESYAVAKAILKQYELEHEVSADKREKTLAPLLQKTKINELAQNLGVGVLTLADIIEQLSRPERDPRDEFSAPLLRSDVLTLSDLHTGMILQGTVRNVVDFGAFVDIGVKQDALLHVSKIPRHKQLHVGEVLEVVILNIDPQKNRIGVGLPE